MPFVAWGRDPVCDEFELAEAATQALDELRREWNGHVVARPIPCTVARTTAEITAQRSFFYTRLGLDQRIMELRPDGRIGAGAAEAECFWRLDEDAGGSRLTLSSRSSDTCRLRIEQDGSWSGEWLRFEQSPVELIPISPQQLSVPSESDGRRPRLLFITPVMPNDYGNGLAMRAGSVLREFTQTHRVSLLIVPLYASGAAKRMPQWVYAACDQVRAVRPPEPSDEYVDQRLREQAWIDEAGRAYFGDRFDTIHVFRLAAVRFAMPYLRRPFLASSRWHLDLDDVESRSGRRLAELYARNGRDDDERAANRSAQDADEAEREVLTTWDRVYVCSQDDKAYLSQQLPNGRAEIAILPNRVTLPLDPPPARRSAPFTFLYVGTMSYFPNLDGVIWFCLEVLPVMRELSAARFRILLVGTGAPPEIRALAHVPGVEFVGEVDAIDPWYERADAVVVPVRAGGGTRIKLLEALAHRRPVVATSLAAEGLDLIDGEHVLLANRPLPFARHCLRLVEDERFAERLAVQGRRAVEQRYGLSTSNPNPAIRS